MLRVWVHGCDPGRVSDDSQLARKVELGDDNLEVAVTLHVLGLCVLDAGRHDDIEAVLRYVLKIMKDHPGEDNIQFSNTLHDLGLCLWDAGRQHDEVEDMLRQAVEITKAKLGKDHIEVAFTTHVLGVCSRDAGEHDKAEGVLILLPRTATIALDHPFESAAFPTACEYDEGHDGKG